MQARRLTTSPRISRRGFTLIELLVVISIIATLMSLLLPAIQNAREAARRTQCLNNERNIATAMVGWATVHNNQLPAYGYWVNDGGSTPAIAPQRSWVVELLPYMDQQGVYDRWDTATGDTLLTNDASVDFANGYSFAVLACPNDDSAFQVAGGLSYVVNAGFGDSAGTGNTTTAPGTAPGNGTDHSYSTEALEWNTVMPAADAEDQNITKATGVFWSDYDVLGAASVKRSSANLGRIYDGTSNTIMLGENLLAGTDIVNVGLNNTWASPEHRSCAFIAPVVPDATTPSLNINTGGYVPVTGIFPNDDKFGVEGESPYLSSLHPGIVVVAFCDGTVRTLSDSIDQSVYLRLMTPSGSRQRTVNSAVYNIEVPLSDTDF